MVACHRLSTGKKLTPLFLESEQLFVFNLSKLSWEFKPFVVAVNSTFFKSPGSSGRVRHTSISTLLFSTPASLVARAGRKNIAPFLFFFPPGFYSMIPAKWERGTIEVCNTQGARGRIWHQFPPKLRVKSGRGSR